MPGGPRVTWGGRRQSGVTITHRLRLGDRAIRVTLRLPRECFDDHARAIDAMQAVAVALVGDLTRRRAGKGILRVRCRIPFGSRRRASIDIERSSIPHLREAISQLGDNPAEILGFNLYAGCVTNFVGALVSITPRRGGLLSRRVTLALPAGLKATHALVNLREKDTGLQARIEEILLEDEELMAYLEVAKEMGWNLDQALVVGLVDRAFRGAWEVANHPGIMYTGSPALAEYAKIGEPPHPAVRYRAPADVLREYTYGQRTQAIVQSLLRMRKDRPYLFESYLRLSKDAYLGEPGAAARELRLIG